MNAWGWFEWSATIRAWADDGRHLTTPLRGALLCLVTGGLP
jgi:hypothetical protein